MKDVKLYMRLAVWGIVAWWGMACQPEIPVTSALHIETEGLALPVNPELYGVTIEEINHAIDGGLYAEMIRNRSFEEGVPPLNCPYDAARNRLITPNGWSIPFIRPDSIPGWHPLAANTRLLPDGTAPVNDKNKRALLVVGSTRPDGGRYGVVAEGYAGLSLRKGERYRLSLFVKGGSFLPPALRVTLEDSTASHPLSEPFLITPPMEWRRYDHTFTANADTDKACLVFATDSATLFWLDVVSLMPEKSWRGYPNGPRADLADTIAALHPRFIRFPGGSFVEGYTAGTYPVWRETIGDIADRKHFWNVWGYGSTNGMGYHEYLQLCEALQAEPVYVINSGVTSQSRRPRYEDITAMDKLVQEALDALAYANAPADSTLGALRARNGHPAPFQLKYIEIGSENFGSDYMKRFDLFRQAIKESYPEVMVISSSPVSKRNRGDWTDRHYLAGQAYFIANHARFSDERTYRRSQGLFIGEFGTVQQPEAGTLQAAVGEACFLIGVENNPEIIRRLAYAPLLGNADYTCNRPAMITFDNHRIAPSPSYYLWQLFATHRGDELLRCRVETYGKPQVTFGAAAIEMFDNSFEIRNARLDQRTVTAGKILTGGWQVDEGTLLADANRWNYLLMGDTTAYNYVFSADIRRTKGSGQIQFHLRDNGQQGEQADFIGMNLGSGESELYRQAGIVKDTLTQTKPFPFENNRWYRVRLRCQDDTLRTYVDDELLHEAVLPPLPSLVAVATRDTARRQLILKVVNTTRHEERTALHIEGGNVKDEVLLLQLEGEPEGRNTLDHPRTIIPQQRRLTYPLGSPMVYSFPPNSISLLFFKED